MCGIHTSMDTHTHTHVKYPVRRCAAIPAGNSIVYQTAVNEPPISRPICYIDLYRVNSVSINGFRVEWPTEADSETARYIHGVGQWNKSAFGWNCGLMALSEVVEEREWMNEWMNDEEEEDEKHPNTSLISFQSSLRSSFFPTDRTDVLFFSVMTYVDVTQSGTVALSEYACLACDGSRCASRYSAFSFM